MSYILEALKKSSEERARLTGAEARSEALPASPRRETRAFLSPWWWIAGLGLGGLAVLALVGIGADRQRPEADQSPIRAAISATAADPVGVRRDEPPAPPSPTARKLPPRSSVATNQPGTTSTPQKPAAPLAAKVPAPAPAPALATANAAAPPPDAGSEMPPELLKQVLAIPVSAHIYSSKPADRMIIIDGQAVREGDSLASGVTIEQITPSGIAVSFKGYRANKPIH